MFFISTSDNLYSCKNSASIFLVFNIQYCTLENDVYQKKLLWSKLKWNTLIGLKRRTLSSPHELFWGGIFGQGQLPIGFFGPDRKLLSTCPTSKKSLSLHFWRPLIHKSHIKCTSFSRSQIQYIYVHFHWISKQLTWFQFQSETTNKACN